jgi:hypothetical protein
MWCKILCEAKQFADSNTGLEMSGIVWAREGAAPWLKLLEVELEMFERILIHPFFVELRGIFRKNIAEHNAIVSARILWHKLKHDCRRDFNTAHDNASVKHVLVTQPHRPLRRYQD